MRSMTLQSVWLQVRSYPFGVVEETKKITWPTRQRTTQMTMIVIGVVAVASVIIGAFDLLFTELMKIVITR
jgi:preprotein translocase SecE subunit